MNCLNYLQQVKMNFYITIPAIIGYSFACYCSENYENYRYPSPNEWVSHEVVIAIILTYLFIVPLIQIYFKKNTGNE